MGGMHVPPQCATFAARGGGADVLDPPGRRGHVGAHGTQDTGGSGGHGGSGDSGDEGGWGGGGGGRWDSEGWKGPEPEPRRQQAPADAPLFALSLGLMGISTLFLVFLGVWLMLRRSAVEWPPAGAPEPPRALWLSTLLLAASSGTMVRMTRAARAGDRGGTGRWLGGSLVLGLAFLAVQVFLWIELARAGLLPSKSGYGAIFYGLTGLHGFHVLLGLGFAAWLAVQTRRAAALPRTALQLAATYWHFMGALWAVLFFVIYFLH